VYFGLREGIYNQWYRFLMSVSGGRDFVEISKDQKKMKKDALSFSRKKGGAVLPIFGLLS